MKAKLSLIENIASFSFEETNLENIDSSPLERKIVKLQSNKPTKPEKSTWTQFNLKIKSVMMSDIETILADTVGITKTGFILQAIHEKIRTFKTATYESS